MIENIAQYKEISLQLVDKLKKEEIDCIEDLIKRRQVILDEEQDNKEFKDILIKKGIVEIDKTIYIMFNENIEKVKEQIKEHKLSQVVNNSYANFNKETLNIFNKKV